MRTCFRAGLAVLFVLSSLVAVPVVAAGGDDNGNGNVAPLTGETLLTSEAGEPGTSMVDGTCNLPGPSTFTFEITGVAIGPYAGTFTESGTVGLGGPFGIDVVSFEAEFTISSPSGAVLVEGTKSLEGVADPGIGSCGAFAFTGVEAEALDVQTDVTYSATITTGSNSGSDSGTSNVTVQDTQLRGPVVQGNGFSFVETFTSTSSGDDDDDDGGDD